jgi:hypothetical protein
VATSASISTPPPSPPHPALVAYPLDQLQALHRDSRDIGILAVGWLLLAIPLLAIALPMLTAVAQADHDSTAVLTVVFAIGAVGLVAGLLAVCAAWFCWRRTREGLYVLIAINLLGLLAFPLGTIMSAASLVILARSGPQLFGALRFRHRELSSELRRRATGS